MEFKDRLKYLREEKELTQRSFSKLLGVSSSTIAMYESGDRNPNFEILSQIADFFNVTTDYLLGRTDDPREKTPETKVTEAVAEDSELAEFWREAQKRDDLQLLFKQIKPLTPKAIAQVIRIVKAIEDEEDKQYNS